MAEVVALLATAAQGAEYCLKLCGILDQLYHATETLRSYRERIQELTPLLRQIQEDPSFDRPEIVSCTQSLAAILHSFTFPDKGRSRRFLTSIAVVAREKRFSRMFDSIEEKKSTLTLYIAKTTLVEVRTGLRHHLPLPARSTMEGKTVLMGIDDGRSPAERPRAESMALTEKKETIEASVRERAPYCQDDQGSGGPGRTVSPQPLSEETRQATPPPGYTKSPHPPTRQENLSSGTCAGSQTQTSETSEIRRTTGSYEGAVMTGHGLMYNGFKVASPDLTDERMRQLSDPKTYSDMVMRAPPPVEGEPVRAQVDTMQNGTAFPEGRAVTNYTRYKNSRMESDGEMINGDTI